MTFDESFVYQAMHCGQSIIKSQQRSVRRINFSLPAEQLDAMPLDELCAQYRDLEKKLLRSWDAPLINDFLCMMAFGLSRKILQKYGGEAGLAYHRDMLIGQGDIIDSKGRQLTCEHLTRRVVRYELDGTVSIVAAE